MSCLNAAICTTTYLERQKCYCPDKKILFKKQLFDFEVKGQGPTKVITVRDTPPYGHAPTYQISLTYLERQKSYGPDKLRWEEAEETEAEEAEADEKIRLKQYVSLRSKARHNNTTLSEQFQNQISKSQKETKSISLTHKYMAAHFSVLTQALQ